MTTQRRFALSALLFALSGCTAIVGGRQQTPECLADSDCPTLDICAGPRVCDGMTHTCKSANTPLNCDDSEPCTEDTCDPAVTDGCVHTLFDADHDGYAPQTCVSATLKGGDCNDSSTAVNPGATEDCNTAYDDNCNGSTTDYPSTITCYADADGDGFHDPNVSMGGACGCPTGYIQPNALGPDCADGVADAFPGQTLLFSHQYCKSGNSTQNAIMSGASWICPNPYYASYDYNCNGTDDKGNTEVGTSCNFHYFAASGGVIKATVISSLVTTISPTIIFQPWCWNTWDGSVAPACGASANQWQCSGSRTCNSAVTTGVVQSCN